MAYNANPFLERRSERTTSDQEFALVFSPKVLEKLSDEAFKGGVHVFRSAPGGGKTTILRAFTPTVLRSFLRAKGTSELKESFPLFVEKGVVSDQEVRLLGVLISCAAGYADLPSSAATIEEGPFRALFDCRVVLRTLRSLAAFLGPSEEALDSIKIEYPKDAPEILGIPKIECAQELAAWAEGQEKRIYAELDAFAGRPGGTLPSSARFESVLWLQTVRFLLEGQAVATNRLLMVDDLHRLRRKQRDGLIDELTVQRPSIPVWLAMRTLVLGDSLLSQGAREGRDIKEYPLEELWSGAKGIHQFSSFAQNVLERRMNRQDSVTGTFAQQLRDQIEPDEVKRFVQPGIAAFRAATEPHANNPRYSEWLARADKKTIEPSMEMLSELYMTRILIARDASKKQMSLDLALPAENIDDKDSSSIRGAAEIQLHEELGVPYYYGLEKLCVMATYNVEELLSMAASLYEGMVANQVLGKKSPELSPSDQEKVLRVAASKRLKFVPKQHTEGTRARQLITSIGGYCRERTFLPNAPYAPGVTGIRLSQSEMEKLQGSARVLGDQGDLLKKVLSECIAENLLTQKQSQASTARESGSIFYLNRTLCTNFGLPLQQGGWQDVRCLDLIDWMTRGWKPQKRLVMGN
ncbi:hypothetical protein [Arenimonas oryziterrae]|uniref:Uncharacterized protein n=1 Tax=Arenimonas oryziterrae DSM 21050 = YC6267 TaxID=1121015 RepID=A0A091AY43_9GAMM|nr:hypothetical protein [Arenimonas oryziterrae]KFN44207.1 hypothetical protein N789_07255 [Arenimonas oryziterrae DSM 21050 = YC6267]